MKLAILGTRGIPAAYGGFETFAEELSRRLIQRGHQVAVYCRSSGGPPEHNGARLVHLPAPRHKYLETPCHTFLATLHLLVRRQDVALYCNAANAVFTPLARLARIPVALNVDGLERRRRKWNCLARAWYRLSEWLATFCPNLIVTDAETIAAYYLERYGAQSRCIPYGAETGKLDTAGALAVCGLEPGRYFLYVSRMEPENNALIVRQHFERVPTPFKLALVGDAPYASSYLRRVRDTQDPRVVLPGGIYGRGYHELLSHAFAYIHATEVGGTHPALVEAMGRGCLVLYLNTPENAEVAGGAGIPFEKDNLSEVIARVLAATEEERNRLRALAVARVRERYDWEKVTDAYEELFLELAGRR